MCEKIIVVCPSSNEYLLDMDISELDKHSNSQLLLFFIKELDLEVYGNIHEEYQLIEENGFRKKIFKIQNKKVREMQDINNLRKLIEQLKTSIHESESRKLNFVKANNALNPNANVDEVMNNANRIAELQTSIESQKSELFVKREELFYVLFGERGGLELLTSKIEAKLSDLSSDKINNLFSQIVQLQTSLEQRGLQIPSHLAEVQTIVVNQEASDDEKRMKVKLIFGILPRIEIEREFVDPKVGDIWKSFWKKAKEIASIEVF